MGKRCTREIRPFLGHKTQVNTAIQKTLAVKPQEFMYLNNGVTALCLEIHPKGAKQAQGGRKRLKLRGFLVINGAQTIASSAKFLADNKGSDISTARVSLTLIKGIFILTANLGGPLLAPEIIKILPARQLRRSG